MLTRTRLHCLHTHIYIYSAGESGYSHLGTQAVVTASPYPANTRGRGHTPTWVPKQRPHLDVFHPWSIPQEYLSSPPGDPGGDKTWILPPGHLGTQAAVAASPYPTSGYPRANGNRKKIYIYVYTCCCLSTSVHRRRFQTMCYGVSPPRLEREGNVCGLKQ